MSIYLSKPEPNDAPVPAVRTDEAKRALLRDAVSSLLQPIADTKAAVDAGSTIDVFAMAVTLKDQITAGTLALDYSDYDGTDITEIVTELLAAV